MPLVPGYHGAEQDPARLAEEAGRIGFPLLIKASAGGGGKGMRVVRSADEFPEALAGARREGEASFGDGTVLLERYLEQPRHVEIQVFADGRGAAVHLFERDCSIQRRHQKVIEEAPAPGLSAALRKRMGEAAVAAARAIGYVGAGTVEFLLDTDGSFYFMEMNTRLQVEHPVTEMITGQDLVAWQLHVAAGEPLPCTQKDLAISGHAFEVRIYAEDPQRDFLPSIGTLTHLRVPAEGAHLRIDTGIRQGDEVSLHYDPMVAKLIVWDGNRESALRRLRRALEEVQIVGVATNVPFLGKIAAHPSFARSEVDTGFIERHRETLLSPVPPAPDSVLALAVLDILLRRDREAQAAAAGSADPWSPWDLTGGWRLNGDNHHSLTLTEGDRSIPVVAHYRQGGYLLELPGGDLEVQGEFGPDGELVSSLGGIRTVARVIGRDRDLTVLRSGEIYRLHLQDPYAQGMEQEEPGTGLTAPMPGKVVAVMVESGAEVRKGSPLLVLEAMKMEHTISAPADGKIVELHYPVGAQVTEGSALVAFEAAGGN